MTSRSWRGLVADLRRAETPRGRDHLGRYLIEGTRLHERACRADVALDAVLLSEEIRDDPSDRIRRLRAALSESGCRIEVAPDAVLESLSGGRSMGALMGLVRIDDPPALAEILGRRRAPGPIVIGVEVEDPGNVGALVRTALASGAAGFAAVGITDPYHPRAVRTSMGSLFKLPIVRYDSFPRALEELERNDMTRIAAVSSGGMPLPRVELPDRSVALLLGSEAFGLDERVRAAADVHVTVPMTEGVDSLSVNAAAAVILYEIGRRRSTDV